MKCLVMAFALTFVLAGTGFAGDIPSVPGPPPTPATAPAENAGEVPTVGLAQQITDEIVLAIFGFYAR